MDTYEAPKEGDATGARTLLMMAANNGHESVVDHLLESGASADLRSTGEGATALFFAAQGGHEGCVRLLLQQARAAFSKCRSLVNPAQKRAVRSLLKRVCFKPNI